MKVRTPPALDDLPIAALQEDFEAFRVEQDGRYLHWDELRHRPARPKISHEVWWRIIKLARRNFRRALPLTDSAGAPFTFAMTDTVQRLVHEVDRDRSSGPSWFTSGSPTTTRFPTATDARPEPCSTGRC
jgi:hypothetical protein